MPYYIYRIKALNLLDKLSEFDSFKAASAHAKTLRATQNRLTTDKIKVIFADNELHAEDLLGQVRVAGPIGDD